MSYYLGIDLGTTYTAAAVHDGSPRRAPEVVTLGERGPTVPSVLCLQPDGGFVAGDAAERHAVTDPQRIARQFKRRLGDPTPLQVGDASVPAEVLTGRLLAWVVDTVVRSRGGQQPDSIALTHPANWGPYKRDLLEKAAEIAGLSRVVLVTEPQAAAISYASQERVEEGAVVAVYDLGGGTFDAAVLRKEPDGGFTILGSPEGIERLGGIDIDAALFARVTEAVGDAYENLDPDDPQALAAVSRLRIDCTQAKEGLSLDNEIRVPVLLPTVQSEVRVTRSELEEMIRPTLAETVTALERALRSASLSPSEVDHVLLVGGSSRVPLVSQLVSSGLGRPVAVDAHPKHAVALGAAIVAARAVGALAATSRSLPPPPGASGAPGSRPAPPSSPAAAAATSPAAGAAHASGPASPPPPPGARPGPPAAAPTRPAPPSAAQAPPPSSRPPAPSGPAPGRPRYAPPGSAAPPPAAAGGYRSGAAVPAPGTSQDLPPGFLTGDAKERRKKTDRRKKRLMMALGVLVLLGAVGATVVLTANSSKKDTVADIAVGDCFNGSTNDVEKVDCDEPHLFELFHVAPAADPAAAFPGAEQALSDGGAACMFELVAYYGASAETAAANGLDIKPIAPTEAQWEDGDTDTYCLAGLADGKALDESIEGKGA
ncbi:MAG TPA: Hsp70 family protein [Acidimicrobiales bacterium]|nr:Hsp70 family protein [Acidimicrobiales bacterium]